MSKKQLIENMKIELDYIVTEYKYHEMNNDSERANKARDEFRSTARAFNGLLRASYKNITLEQIFPSSIISYKMVRECELQEVK